MKNLLAAVASVCLLSAPATAGEECHAAEAKPAKEAKAGPGWSMTRGEKLTGAPKVALKELLAGPEKHEGKTITVEAKIRKSCEKKGCWMELAQDEKSTGIRVTFKDYGFFVPLDAAGADARVQGVVKVAELTDEHAKHLTSEGATVPRGKDGKPREIQLIATGVELRRQ
jgi:hypothetical protein